MDLLDQRSGVCSDRSDGPGNTLPGASSGSLGSASAQWSWPGDWEVAKMGGGGCKNRANSSLDPLP